MSLLQDPFKELPQVGFGTSRPYYPCIPIFWQIVFTLRAIQHPAFIPISLASLNLITQTTQSFTFTLWSLFSETDSFADKLMTVRRLYEVTEIKNEIVDGSTPFPEDTASLKLGVAIEFRWACYHFWSIL